jgi:hypothetical protein
LRASLISWWLLLTRPARTARLIQRKPTSLANRQGVPQPVNSGRGNTEFRPALFALDQKDH